MFRQDDPKLQMTRRFGCYVCSLANVAEKHSKKSLSEEKVFRGIALSVAQGYCEENLFVKYPARIIDVFFDLLSATDCRAYYVGWWNEDTGERFWNGTDYNETICRYAYGNIYHFKQDDYDPHPELELGGLTGKRYFRIVCH